MFRLILLVSLASHLLVGQEAPRPEITLKYVCENQDIEYFHYVEISNSKVKFYVNPSEDVRSALDLRFKKFLTAERNDLKPDDARRPAHYLVRLDEFVERTFTVPKTIRGDSFKMKSGYFNGASDDTFEFTYNCKTSVLIQSRG